ncbi:MAG TPA: DUF1566 domain-containing protein [Ideonella sp.]|nr:DUF1566 domain-containing protein [Ideonella sp.]
MPSLSLNASLLATLAVLAGGASLDAAARPQLNDTGIEACLDSFSQIVACGGTGQDAEFGRDVSRPADGDGRLGFRFTRLCNSGEAAGEGHCPATPAVGQRRHEWGCTRDENTGLTWEIKTTDGGRHDAQRNFTFYTPSYDPDGQYGGPHDATGFVAAVNAENFCGASDWRLPTASELMGLVDMGLTTLPPVDQRFLPNTAATLFWAAGTVLGTVTGFELAWGSDYGFGFGAISAQFRSDQRPIRLVRGQPGPAKRFVVSADRQQADDGATGLAWRRCLEGQRFVAGACRGKALSLSWPDALARAQAQADETGVAWRLPNQKELASLLDHERARHIDTAVFPPQQVAGTQWTSSPMMIYRIPRCVSFTNGTTSFCNAPTQLGVRLVRDTR